MRNAHALGSTSDIQSDTPQAELSLKEAQYEVLRSILFKGKDTNFILPTGYGKLLINQLLPNIFDCFL